MASWLSVWAQPIRSRAAALSRREGAPSPHDLTCLLRRRIYLRRRIARAPPQPRVRRRRETGRPPSFSSHAPLLQAVDGNCSKQTAATSSPRRLGVGPDALTHGDAPSFLPIESSPASSPILCSGIASSILCQIFPHPLFKFII